MPVKQFSAKPQWVRQWPRGLRLGLYWVLVLITLLVLIPAFIVGSGYLLGFGSCVETNSIGTPVLCSPRGRLLLAAVLISVGLPLARMWLGFLARSLNFKDADFHLPRDVMSRPLPAILGKVTRSLSFGQHLTFGCIWFRDRGGRYAECEENVLTFWSVYAFRQGWLKENDEAAIVYQKVPLLKGLKLALAFCTGATLEVRTVAVVTMGLSVLIAVACIFILTLLKPPLAEFFIPLCACLIVVNSLYLVLAARPKTILQACLARKSRASGTD
jgi:hypothetical protein